MQPLGEPELLALAMAFGDRLRGRASLQVPAHSGRLHPRDEQWLALELQKLARRSVRLESRAAIREFVAHVREAVDVWHAIACCPGFTGGENPVFWRRVVSHTYRRTHLRQHGCSDEFTFFRSGAFPRLRLYFEDRLAYETTDANAREEAIHVDTVCREFFGLPQGDGDDLPPPPPPTAEYEAAMARLRPFISQARYGRVIPVALDLPSWDTTHLYPHVVQLLEDVTAASATKGGACRAARFRIEELSLDDMRVLFHDDAFVSYQKWLQLPGLRITHWWWKTQSMDMAATVPPSAIRVGAGLEPGALASLQTLLVNRHTVTDQQFEGLCAALPLARSLHHVRFSELSRRHDWEWLAFALFHRSTETSSWKELSVDMCHLDADDLAAMAAVRDGGLASLLTVLSNRFQPDGRACSVRLQVGTTVNFDEPGQDPYVVRDESTVFDAYDQCPQVTGSRRRVYLVVPGHGVGYVEVGFVVEQSAISGRSSCSLTHFRATVMTSRPTELRDWICLIGSSKLQLVEVMDHTQLPPSSVVTILSSCIALTSLNVVQDGSLWTEGSTVSPDRIEHSWTHLRTLNVCGTSPSLAIALLNVLSSTNASPLPGLRQLRLEITPSENDSDAGDESLQHQVAMAAAQLLRRVKRISHLTLHGITPARGRGEIQTLTYEDYRRDVLATLGIDETSLDTSHDARVAFLSVFYCHAWKSCMLTPDLLRIVLAYAGRETRNVWIEL